MYPTVDGPCAAPRRTGLCSTALSLRGAHAKRTPELSLSTSSKLQSCVHVDGAARHRRLGSGAAAGRRNAAVAETGMLRAPDALLASQEFRHLCLVHLRMLAFSFQRYGELIASVYLRVPESLKSGALELRRAAWVGRSQQGGMEHCETLHIGGPGSSLTEENIVAERSLSLPFRGDLVVPLSYSNFLVGLLVLEGFWPQGGQEDGPVNWGKFSQFDVDVVSPLAESDDDETLAETLAYNNPDALLSTFISSYTVSDGAESDYSDTNGRTSEFWGASDVLTDAADEEQTSLMAAALSAGCAMELRAVIAAAASRGQARTVRDTLTEMQQSARTFRTMGALLLPRLEKGRASRDMAEAMLLQGDHVGDLVTALQSALHPDASPLTGPSAFGATQLEPNPSSWQPIPPASMLAPAAGGTASPITPAKLRIEPPSSSSPAQPQPSDNSGSQAVNAPQGTPAPQQAPQQAAQASAPTPSESAAAAPRQSRTSERGSATEAAAAALLEPSGMDPPATSADAFADAARSAVATDVSDTGRLTVRAAALSDSLSTTSAATSPSPALSAQGGRTAAAVPAAQPSVPVAQAAVRQLDPLTSAAPDRGSGSSAGPTSASRSGQHATPTPAASSSRSADFTSREFESRRASAAATAVGVSRELDERTGEQWAVLRSIDEVEGDAIRAEADLHAFSDSEDGPRWDDSLDDSSRAAALAAHAPAQGLMPRPAWSARDGADTADGAAAVAASSGSADASAVGEAVDARAREHLHWCNGSEDVAFSNLVVDSDTAASLREQHEHNRRRQLRRVGAGSANGEVAGTCHVVVVLAQLLSATTALCQATGVDLVVCSPALIAAMQRHSRRCEGTAERPSTPAAAEAGSAQTAESTGAYADASGPPGGHPGDTDAESNAAPSAAARRDSTQVVSSLQSSAQGIGQTGQGSRAASEVVRSQGADDAGTVGRSPVRTRGDAASMSEGAQPRESSAVLRMSGASTAQQPPLPPPLPADRDQAAARAALQPDPEAASAAPVVQDAHSASPAAAEPARTAEEGRHDAWHDPLFTVEAHHHSVSCTIGHVLDAALQRTARAGRVEVFIQRGLNEVVVDVKDTGVSLAEDLIELMPRAQDRWRSRGLAASSASAAANFSAGAGLGAGAGGGAGGSAQQRSAAGREDRVLSAEAAMQRVSAGVPVGSGSVSLHIAKHIASGLGGQLTVRLLDAEGRAVGPPRWICTRLTLPVSV